MQKEEHRVSGIAVEGGLVGGVATMDGRMRVGMAQKIAGGRGACWVLPLFDV